MSKKIRPRISEDEFNIVKKYRKNADAFESALHDSNFEPPENWSHGWLKTKDVSVFVRNTTKDVDYKEDFKKIIEESLKDVKPIETPTVVNTNEKAMRVVISDAHVGMEPAGENALFSFKYDRDVFKAHLMTVYESVVQKQNIHGDFDVVFVDDLGDGLDGFNKETTRGGHALEQNMSNKEAWETYVFEKLKTCMDIVSLNCAAKFVFRNVANDNHSGDYGWTANMAIKMTLERMFDNVEYVILNKPVQHFFYGKHCHILTHGKDKGLMMRNWPLHVNDKVETLIRQYIDHNGIDSKYIHFDKGDLHQLGYDRKPKFDYRNFMSFAPPSQWVQINFGTSYCGFSMQVIPKFSNQIEHTDIFFELERA